MRTHSHLTAISLHTPLPLDIRACRMSCHLHTPRVTPTLTVHAPQRSPSQNHAPRALHPGEHPHHPPVQTSHALARLHIHQPNTPHVNPSPPRTASRFHSHQTVVLVPDTRHGRSLAIARHASNVSAGHSIRIHLLTLSLVDTHKHPCRLSQQTIQVDNILSTSPIVVHRPRATRHQRHTPLTKSPSRQVTEEQVLVAIPARHRRLKSTTLTILSTRTRRDAPSNPSTWTILLCGHQGCDLGVSLLTITVYRYGNGKICTAKPANCRNDNLVCFE